MSEAPRRIVLRPPNWLGDAVLALPAMAAIRRAHPGAHLTLAAPPAVAALFREQTDVAPDDVRDLPGGSSASAEALRAGGYDTGVLFPNSFRSAWVLRSAGVPERWGFATSARGWLLTRRVGRPRRDTGRHQADYYRALVDGLGMAVDDRLPRVAPTDTSAREAAALLAPAGGERPARLVGLAPGAAYGQAKQWPPDRVAALVARLVREADVTCVVVGAGHDRDAARAIESWLRREAPDVWPRVIDLVGRTSLGTLTGVVAAADVFVANDSGAMHLAAAAGRPVVAMFGPTNERATRPLGDHDVLTAPAFCRPCMMRDCPIDHRCMKRITVERVADAVLARLGAAGAT